MQYGRAAIGAVDRQLGPAKVCGGKAGYLGSAEKQWPKAKAIRVEGLGFRVSAEKQWPKKLEEGFGGMYRWILLTSLP